MTSIEKFGGKNKVKPTSFKQHLLPPENKFENGFVLEAADMRIAIQDSPSCNRRQRPIAFSLAKVIDKEGPRIRLRHLGTDDRNDFWLSIDSDLIRPYPSGKDLTVPFGFMSSHSAWRRLMGKVSNEGKLAPKEWFPPPPKDPGNNKFKIGDRLEAVDRRNSQLICPATVTDVKGNHILVSFEGWSGAFDYWAAYNSQDLFPVGWCSKAKHKLQKPGDSTSKRSVVESMVTKLPRPAVKRSKSSRIPIKKMIKLEKSPGESNLNSPDSERTHVCTAEEDEKVIEGLVQNQQKGKQFVSLKSKGFRDIFQRWTQKNAVESSNQNKKCPDDEQIDSGVCSDVKDIHNESDKVLYVKDRVSEVASEKDRSSPEKFSDTNSEAAANPIECSVSPNPTVNLSVSTRPPSPCGMNSSQTNSIVGDYKQPSDTSGISGCTKLDSRPSPLMSVETNSVQTHDHLPNDPNEWTINDVKHYLVSKNPSLESVAEEFGVHEIDGQALMLLNMNTLRQYMKIKLGPAIKIDNIIRNLSQGKL